MYAGPYSRGEGEMEPVLSTVGRCRLTVSKPVLKAPTISALEATI
jgi:hypothetical protein